MKKNQIPSNPLSVLEIKIASRVFVGAFDDTVQLTQCTCIKTGSIQYEFDLKQKCTVFPHIISILI